MRAGVYFFMIFILMISSQSEAASSAGACSTVDLRSDPRLPAFEPLGDVGWCFALSTARLISFQYLVGKPVSYIDIALKTDEHIALGNGYQNADFSRFGQQGDYAAIEGGFVSDAFAEAKKSGACLEKDISPEARKLAEGFIDGVPIAQMGQEIENEIQRVPGTPQYLIGAFEQIQDVQRDFKMNRSEKNPSQDLARVNAIFPRVDADGLRQVLGASKNRPGDFLPMIDRLNCKDPVVVPQDAQMVSDSSVLQGFTSETLFAEIDRQLDRRQIVAMDYYFNLHDLSQVGQGGGAHSSIIAGRKYDPRSGQCEYLVMDSHSESCEPYDAKIRAGCDAGFIWVPALTLAPDIYGIDYIR